MGDLGHMAVKFAHAVGATVTVLSQSLKKQEESFRFGADHCYATSDGNIVADLAGSFDLITNTVSAAIDINAHLQRLTLDGALVNVGAPAESLPVQAFFLITGRRPDPNPKCRAFSGSTATSLASSIFSMSFAEPRYRPGTMFGFPSTRAISRRYQ